MGAVKALYVLEQIRVDELVQDNKTVRVKVQLVNPTARAVLVYVTVKRTIVDAWLPKSQIIEPDPIALKLAKIGDVLVLLIPFWLAKSKGLTHERERR